VSQTREQDPTTRWGHSLRTSQARRAAAARVRRWSRRRRITAATMSVAVLGFGGVAAAQSTTGAAAPAAATTTAAAAPAGGGVAAVQAKLGVTADGVLGPQTRKALRAWQRKQGLTADGVIGPQTLKAMGIAAGSASTRSAKESSRSAGSASANPALEKIAQCESGGDPTAVSSDGTYRGKYQFDRQTWKANGGTGDPAAAPEATQDAIAAKLLAARGTAPWPVCG
jgi:peptidoglycan hydrolase-like protein with peptidoglycan-binding domain